MPPLGGFFMAKPKLDKASLRDDPHIALPRLFFNFKRGSKTKIKKVLRAKIRLLFPITKKNVFAKNRAVFCFAVIIFLTIFSSNLIFAKSTNQNQSFLAARVFKSENKINKSSDRMINYQIEPQQLEYEFRLPLENLQVSQNFTTYHPAIDFATDYGSAIYPIASGVVSKVGWDPYGKGKVVIINHPNGLQSLYAHLAKTMVEENTEVGTNQVIAEVGTTGHSTGAHLHLEIIDNNRLVNPGNLIPAI